MRKVTTALMGIALLGITGCASADGEAGQDLEAERTAACADAKGAIESLEAALREQSGVTPAVEEATAVFDELGQRDLGDVDGSPLALMYSSVANGLERWGGIGEWPMDLDFDMLVVKSTCEIE